MLQGMWDGHVQADNSLLLGAAETCWQCPVSGAILPGPVQEVQSMCNMYFLQRAQPPWDELIHMCIPVRCQGQERFLSYWKRGHWNRSQGLVAFKVHVFAVFLSNVLPFHQASLQKLLASLSRTLSSVPLKKPGRELNSHQFQAVS